MTSHLTSLTVLWPPFAGSSGVAPTADYRTLYAQAATRSTSYLYVSAVGRKPSTEIDPSQTAATRK